MVFAMIGALVVSQTIVPVALSWVVRDGKAVREPRWLRAVRRVYLRLLERALDRRGWTLGLAAAAFPSLVPLVGQAAVPGLVLVGVAAGLHRLTANRSALDRPVEGGSASSLTRTAAPTVSLIVAGSNRPGSTATAGRDAS